MFRKSITGEVAARMAEKAIKISYITTTDEQLEGFIMVIEWIERWRDLVGSKTACAILLELLKNHTKEK